MLAVLLLLLAVCRAEDVRPQELEKLEEALESAAKESSQGLNRIVRQDDPLYSLPKTLHLLHHHQQPQQPVQQPPTQIIFNPPIQPPPQPPPTWPIRPPPPPPAPAPPCTPNLGVQVSEGHFATPNNPASYSASIPYISGYKLTPIIGQKHVVVNDVAHHPGPVPCVDSYGTPGQVSYYQQVYSHGRQAEEILKPFEEAGYFVQPPDPNSQLRSVKEYQEGIDDLSNHIEHLESLRDNAVAGTTS